MRRWLSPFPNGPSNCPSTMRRTLASGRPAAGRPLASVRRMVEGQLLGPLGKGLSQRRIDAYSGVRPGSIHTDEAWAAAKGFRKPLAQGMMTTAYVSELMVGLLGRGFVEGGRMDVALLAPVFADDVLTVSGVVSGLRDDGDGSSTRVEATVRATNAEGRTTMAGTASGRLLPEDAAAGAFVG